MSDNQSENSHRWNGDTANHPTIHTNRFEPVKQKTDAELQREREQRSYRETHSLGEISKLPQEARYWGMTTETMTYDSGYGDHGKPDMTTSTYWQIVWFETDTALEDWVLKQVKDNKPYQVIRAEPVSTTVKAVFSIVK